MRIDVVGKNIVITDGIRGNVEEKLKKLSPFLKEDTTVRVIVRTVKDDQIIEVTINENGVTRAEARDKDLYNAIKEVEEKLVRILRKRKERRIEKHRNPSEKPYDMAEGQDAEIVKHKEVTLSYMSPEDAMFEIEALDHGFYLYINRETGNTEAIYKRLDGDFGVITVLNGKE